MTALTAPDAATAALDPALDLVLEREVPLSPEQVFAAWTTPELLVQWFAPRPFETTACEIDLRPGGVFATTMRSPDGDDFPGAGCILDVVADRRLVWTSALGPGFRPNPAEGLHFTAELTLEPTTDGGTRYRAVARHADADSCRQHAEMGFVDGWGLCLDQLVEVMSAR